MQVPQRHPTLNPPGESGSAHPFLSLRGLIGILSVTGAVFDIHFLPRGK